MIAAVLLSACGDSHGLSPNMRAGELLGDAYFSEDPEEERALAERAIKILREHIASTPASDPTYWHARSQIVFGMQHIRDSDVIREFAVIIRVHKSTPAGFDVFELAYATARRLGPERRAEAVQIIRDTGAAVGISQTTIDLFAKEFEDG